MKTRGRENSLPLVFESSISDQPSLCWKQPIFIVCPFSRFPAIKPPPLLVLHFSRCPGKFRSAFTKFKLLSSLSRRERLSSVSSISGTIFQYASGLLICPVFVPYFDQCWVTFYYFLVEIGSEEVLCCWKLNLCRNRSFFNVLCDAYNSSALKIAYPS